MALNAILLGAIACAFLVLMYRPAGDHGIEIEVRDPMPGIDEIRVDVGGAVLRPGLLTASPGERVGDVIARAGGAAADADLAAINLSRRVRDEDHILVPRQGERAAPIDLNAASIEQLEALPAIGPTYARAIVTARDQRGAFTSTDQLVDLRLLPRAVYDRVRDMMTVR